MKFGQLIEQNTKYFPTKIMQNMSQGDQFQSSFCFFKKTFKLGKSKWSAVYFYYTSLGLNLSYNKNKLYKTLDYWSRNMLNFDILEKSLGLISPSRMISPSCMIFKKNVYHIILTDQISLSEYLYFLRYWAICLMQLFLSQIVTS